MTVIRLSRFKLSGGARVILHAHQTRLHYNKFQDSTTAVVESVEGTVARSSNDPKTW
jgi:hypothetical protein